MPALVQITRHDYDLLTREEKMDETCFYSITDYSEPKTIVVEKQVLVQMLPKTCHKCGAPLVNNKCEYCGTEY